MTILSSCRIMGINNISKWPKAVMMVTIIPWLDFFRIFKISLLPFLTSLPEIQYMIV